MSDHEKQQKATLRECVLQEITSGRVQPKPRYWFWLREVGVWTLWSLSIAIGAVAIAVMTYVAVYSSTAFVEATHPGWAEFIFETLPLMWLTVFLAMTALAYLNVRRTRRGYRYPFGGIVLSSLALSIVGGGALHYIGISHQVDQVFGNRLPLYSSQEKFEYKLWQQPDAGRLIGTLATITVPSRLALFEDANGQRWELSIFELREADKDTLLNQTRVRIIGIASSTPFAFHACGVFPWLFEERVAYRDLQRERDEFLARMYAHKSQSTKRLAADQRTDRGQCPDMPVVDRVSRMLE